MKYKINYKNGVCSIPEDALEKMHDAGACELRVLITLCSRQGDIELYELAEAANCSEDEAREAIGFWRGAGIVDASGKASNSSKKDKKSSKSDNDSLNDSRDKSDGEKTEKKEKKLRSADELPKYTSEELSNILENRKDTATLINECQNIMGKVFNVREINVLMGLVDYLQLDCEYIMILLTYCVSIGKKTLHYAEKMAFAFYDLGIIEASELSAELKRREAALDAEAQIRGLFGIGARAFTTKEKKLISSWVNDMGYSIEIIKKAYEVTADATGNASIPYANSVLERWNAAGLRTLEEIEASYQQKKNEGKEAQGSFDTDDFFEAAVRRSLGED